MRVNGGLENKMQSPGGEFASKNYSQVKYYFTGALVVRAAKV
jgi:hypothetical protein